MVTSAEYRAIFDYECGSIGAGQYNAGCFNETAGAKLDRIGTRGAKGGPCKCEAQAGQEQFAVTAAVPKLSGKRQQGGNANQVDADGPLCTGWAGMKAPTDRRENRHNGAALEGREKDGGSRDDQQQRVWCFCLHSSGESINVDAGVIGGYEYLSATDDRHIELGMRECKSPV